MKKSKYIILMFFLLLPFNVLAECNTEELARYKRLASNVNYSIESIKDGKGQDTDTFDIKFTNLVEDLYVSNSFQYLNYYPSNGIAIVSGYYGGISNHFAIRSSKCSGINLLTMDINLPSYNEYYNQDICKEYKNFPVCQKWLTSSIDMEDIQDYIDKNTVKAEKTINKKDVKGIFDYALDYYIKYYYIGVPATIVVLVLIILIYKVYKRKKESLF